MKKFYFGPLLFCYFLLFNFQTLIAQNPPTGFASITVSSQWNEAVGLTFSEDGTEMFVWERGGRVWVVINGQKQLLLDISPEVGGWHDLGMLGFALHPDFEQNGYFYVFYIVDRHHLINFGTGAYSPTTNDYFSATIGRLTRYTATKNGNAYNVNLASRTVLLGATKSTGLPQLSPTHGVGSLVFGTDKTLLLSTGDGASPNGNDAGSFPDSYYVQALADGIIRPEENVGAFRSQMLSSLNGKILRIDPETGEGVPSNPYYDPGNPNANISKVWALGLRNPFRMDIKPGTGSHNPAEGNPGILYFGDVGWFEIEDLSVVDRPAQNFGWPIFEGLTPCLALAPINTPNYDAPNPLYQVNGCTQQFFYFQDLLKQETPSGTANFTNPCNGSPIPSNIPTFVHTRPLIDWKHSSLQARTGTFNGTTATVANLGAAGSPVSGPQFKGSAAVGGVFYTGTDFPAEYQNTYFFGDYSEGWIRNLTVDANDKPVAVRDFVSQNAIVVGMKTHPTEEGLFYINFPSEIKKIIYTSNRPPVAVASVNNSYGPAPLNVQFTGSGSSDFEEQPLLYEWNFGDGSPLSTAQNPTHSFTAPPGVPTKYTITLKVTDNLGAIDQTSLVVSVNNTPPQVSITSPINNALYLLTQETTYPLEATVTDQEHNTGELTYAWQTFLHHESHQHPNPIDNSPISSLVTEPVGCDGETYFYRIVLTVTDQAGASTTQEVRLYPDCGNQKINPFITWANPAPIVTGVALSSTQLNATATHNGAPVAGVFTYTPPLGTVLPTGAGQQLSVSFLPADTELYNSVNKVVAINVNPPTGTATFYRAINVNGPALAIDGNNWTASTGAPNFSYTTNQWAFSDPTVPLIPATDANRTTMIRSSVWGNVNLAMSAVPAGTYQVWVYVWEDNSPTVISISLEGLVVQANYNTGPAGTWRKLGPFQAVINDGTINVSAIGAGNVSGLEVWTAGPPPANRPPVVANALIDQSGSVGAPFSYTFAANSFTDPDAGNILTYTSTLENGTPLPGWLTFTASTRNFSGVPLVANLGSINVRVTASDGGGETVSDIFTLTVTPAVKVTPLITWANPSAIVTGTALSATQLNATATYSGTPVAGTFTYTPPLGTVLPLGAGQQLSVNFVPTNTDLYNPVSKTVTIDVISTPTSTFYRAININGPALLIDGNNWTASTGAPNFSYTTNQWAFSDPTVPLIPATDANRTNMIRSSVWGNVNLAMSAVPAGTYQVWLYVWEDNSPAVISISLEGIVVQANYNTGPAGTWRKLGPFQTAINDGTINVAATGGAANVSGLEVWTAGAPPANRPPVVANALIDQNASVGAPFSYTFAANSFTDPDAGTILTYTSTLESGTPLPGWLAFTGSTRNFSGVPLVANLGSINVRVTASDGGGETVSDIFTLTVTPAVKVTPVVNWTNPSAIVVGTALSTTQLNATATYSGTPVAGIFIYSPPLGMVLPLGSAQQLLVDFLPNDTTLYNSASKTVTIDVTEKVTPLLTWANPLAIVTGTALSATQLNATATYSGTPVAGTFTYTPPLGTVLPLGAGQQLSVDFAPTNTDLYNPVSKTVAIDVISTPTSSFYRAININGPALLIDGNNWTASTGAPNFSYTTNQWAFSDPTVPLIPATDANRTTMIRSSVWGNVNLAMSAVPAGTYQVWLYVWEDNSPTVISISLEGIVVQANYNTGPAGTWSKLGPFQATINDGTINVAATGAGNVSGLEVWTAGPPPANRPPVVANALIDQSGSVGAPFSYTFAANSFTDPDAGTTLTYTSTLENGTPLPGWLAFTGSTRNFSGVPLAANLGSINVRVTASDGGGESVSDIFTLTVTPAVKVTPLITWANPLAIVTGTALSATQLNATATYSGTPVAGTFTYTPPLGTVLPLGAGQQLSVDFVPTNTDLYNLVSKTVAIDVISTPTSTFYRAININGPALLIDGNNWTASTGAPNFSYTTNQWAFSDPTVPLIPATDANRTTMIRSSVWGNVNLAMSAVPAGTYQVWLYVWEDNSPAVISISLEGTVVQANYNTGPAGTWRKLGPFQATINDGTINVSATGGAANVSGLEVWSVTNQSPNGRVAFGTEKGVENQQELAEDNPDSEELTAYPNPFSGKVNITFTAKESAPTQLAIYDTRGVMVRVLFEDVLSEGNTRHLEVEAGAMVNGVYILRLMNGHQVKHTKLILAR